MMKTADLKLTQEWDKTFPKSDKVDHSKVTFINRYGITLAADMCLRTFRSGQGAVLGSVRSDDSRAWIPDDRFRSELYRRERR